MVFADLQDGHGNEALLGEPPIDAIAEILANSFISICISVGRATKVAFAMTKEKIVVYQKPTCTTCRQVHAALKESGVDFDAVDYYVDPIPKPKLIQLIDKMGIKPRDLLRKNEAIYKELRLGEGERSDAEIVELMVQHPDLIQRPIVERGPRAILARPAERLKDIL
jgi:arsenate reductase